MLIPKKYIIWIAIVIITIALFAINSRQVASETIIEVKPQPEAISQTYTPNFEAWQALEDLTSNQNVWIRKIIMCESSGNPKAINPEDRDFTPSYGLLEFKPETFFLFAKKYLIKVTDVMDPNEQIQIMVKMIKDSENINWQHQFPDCVRKHDQPPIN